MHIYFGHHKAATSWVVKVLSDLAYLNAFTVETFDTAPDLHAALLDDSHGLRHAFVAYRNAEPASLARLSPFRGFHIIRDPRDILVSSYFSHLNSHPTERWPELAAHKRELGRLDLAEGLLCDMEFCNDLPTRGHKIAPIHAMAAWDYDHPDIMEIRYEQLILNPYETLIGAFGFLGLLRPDELGITSLTAHLAQILYRRLTLGGRGEVPSLYSWNLLAAIYDNRYQKKAAGRPQGVEDPTSHYRKGVAGDWRNYFQEQHKRRFAELFGDALTRLRYESNDNW
jgi:hypothetical protein